jgi:hypothetical protein
MIIRDADGRHFVAIDEMSEAAQSMAMNISRRKALSFSRALAGLAQGHRFQASRRHVSIRPLLVWIKVRNPAATP